MSVNPLLMNTVLQGCGCVDASLDRVVQCSPFAAYAIAQQAYYLLHVVSTARAMLSSPSSAYTAIVRLAAVRKRGRATSRVPDGAVPAEDVLGEGSGGLGQRVAILGAGAVAEAYVLLLLGESPPLVHPTRVTVISAQRPTTNQLCNAFEAGVRWSSRAQARPILASCDLLVLACGTVEELLDLLKEKDGEGARMGSQKHGSALLKPTAIIFLAVTGAPQTKVALLLQIDESLIVCADESTLHRAPRIAADYHSKSEACTAQHIKRVSYSLSFLGDAARQAEGLREEGGPVDKDDAFSFQPTQWGFTTANTTSILSTLSREAIPHKSFFSQVWRATLTWVGRLIGHKNFSLEEHLPSLDARPRTSSKGLKGSPDGKFPGSAAASTKESIRFEGSILCAVLSVIPPSSYTTVAAALLGRYQRNFDLFGPDIAEEPQWSHAVQCGGEPTSTLQTSDSLGVLPLAYHNEAELNHDMQLHYTEILQKNAYKLHASS